MFSVCMRSFSYLLNVERIYPHVATVFMWSHVGSVLCFFALICFSFNWRLLDSFKRPACLYLAIGTVRSLIVHWRWRPHVG